MKQPIIFCSPLLATLVMAPLAHAASFYASPSGTGSTCTEAAPCTASTAVGKLNAGDTAYLRGGTYTSSLNIPNTTSGSAGSYITVAAYPGELPIINGGINVLGTYIRIDGLAGVNGQTGIGNHWTGGGTTNSNGNLQFVNCIADMNTKTGIAFQSAKGLLIQQCIAAHNGSSTTTSWSSGVDLFGAQGSYTDNIVERSVAFENVDMQVHSDGSGFIVDDIGTGASFINNIGFRNGGSCIRLTTSTNTHIINNSCYHDGLDTQASGPSNPGEIFFSSSATTQGAVLINNLAAAAGWNNTQSAFVNNGSLAIGTTNVGVNSNGATPFFTDPAGLNPDFRLTASATAEIDKGTTANGAPMIDIGFDPKCITKTAPTGTGIQSWWIYSIDYTYIAGIGGIAKCFNPKTRTATPDIGAYEYNGTAAGGSPGIGGAASTGGMASTGGSKATGGAPGVGGVASAGGVASNGGSNATGGVVGTGGTIVVGAGGVMNTGGAIATGGVVSAGGTPGTGGIVAATGGAVAIGGASSVAGNVGIGGTIASAGATSTAAAGTSTTGGAGSSTDVGSCSCRVAGQPSRSTSFAGLGLLGLLVMRTLRRRRPTPGRASGSFSKIDH